LQFKVGLNKWDIIQEVTMTQCRDLPVSGGWTGVGCVVENDQGLGVKVQLALRWCMLFE
jgi:hypothetical protein